MLQSVCPFIRLSLLGVCSVHVTSSSSCYWWAAYRFAMQHLVICLTDISYLAPENRSVFFGWRAHLQIIFTYLLLYASFFIFGVNPGYAGGIERELLDNGGASCVAWGSGPSYSLVFLDIQCEISDETSSLIAVYSTSDLFKFRFIGAGIDSDWELNIGSNCRFTGCTWTEHTSPLNCTTKGDVTTTNHCWTNADLQI